jgi:hypothetical protein
MDFPQAGILQRVESLLAAQSCSVHLVECRAALPARGSDVVVEG